VSTFVQQVAYVGVVFYGVYLIAAERLTVGGLIACALLTGRVLAPLSQIASLLTRYHQARTALLSIDRLMQLPVERPEGHEFLSRPALQGAIEFRDVTFNYPGETGAALTQVSFRIAPGERVALIGRVGSGKTTIEKLVMGLYEPTSGSILIDAVESRQWDPPSCGAASVTSRRTSSSSTAPSATTSYWARPARLTRPCCVLPAGRGHRVCRPPSEGVRDAGR
jgi:ATP-binding cassette subfamily C protein LapB